MKTILLYILSLFLLLSCEPEMKIEDLKTSVLETEKSFEKMASEKGIAEAFNYFADENAVLKRENDTLIIGKENIKKYYLSKDLKNVKLNWTPDFIDLSDDGTMAYTYGKYLMIVQNADSTTTEFKGVFHTVWKKQKDNSWKYVWD